MCILIVPWKALCDGNIICYRLPIFPHLIVRQLTSLPSWHCMKMLQLPNLAPLHQGLPPNSSMGSPTTKINGAPTYQHVHRLVFPLDHPNSTCMPASTRLSGPPSPTLATGRLLPHPSTKQTYDHPIPPTPSFQPCHPFLDQYLHLSPTWSWI